MSDKKEQIEFGKSSVEEVKEEDGNGGNRSQAQGDMSYLFSSLKMTKHTYAENGG